MSAFTELWKAWVLYEFGRWTSRGHFRQKITHGDMETRDRMAYWKLEVVGCDWWAGHLKEVRSGSWMWSGLCWAVSQRLCLGCSSTGSSCGWLPPQRSLSRSPSVKELPSPLPIHHLSFFFLFMECSVIADTLFLFIVCIPTLNYSFMRVGTRSVMFIAVFPAPRTSDNVCGMNVSMDFIL